MNIDGAPSCSTDANEYDKPGDVWLAVHRHVVDMFLCIADFGLDEANAALVVNVVPTPGASRLATCGRSCRELLGFIGR
jgi:hypothetical protein